MRGTIPIRRLLRTALLGGAGMEELSHLEVETIRALPGDLREAFDWILADAGEHGAVDGGRILEKANGQSTGLELTFAALLSEEPPTEDAAPEAEQDGTATAEETPPEDLVLDPANPMPAARQFVKSQFICQGERVLHHQGGEFFRWTGSCYPPQPEEEVRAELWRFLEGAKVLERKKLVDYKPNRARVGDALDALRAVVNLPARISPPAWLDAPEAPAKGFLACRNGILYFPTGDLLPHTPKFFARHAIPTDYRPDAPPPSGWMAFLRDLWGEDAEAIGTLQELFGYCLDSDTRQQKIFLIVTPRRGGKGTVARVLTGLLGQENVAGPTLASLGSNFGLAPLIGKNVAIIADARLGGRADQQAIAERLLSVSGEDSLTIDRKFLPAWTGRLPTRFILLTNELPRIADASGALASRFIVLTHAKSFLGQEDPGLTGRLLTELPGIFSWALEGWRRLRRRGYFVQPESAREAIAQLEDLGSPVAAFLKERCQVGPQYQVGREKLYDAWCCWCESQGRVHPGTAATFGRDLRAALPEIKTERPRDGETRARYYSGVGLTAEMVQQLLDWKAVQGGPRT